MLAYLMSMLLTRYDLCIPFNTLPKRKPYSDDDTFRLILEKGVFMRRSRALGRSLKWSFAQFCFDVWSSLQACPSAAPRWKCVSGPIDLKIVWERCGLKRQIRDLSMEIKGRVLFQYASFLHEKSVKLKLAVLESNSSEMFRIVRTMIKPIAVTPVGMKRSDGNITSSYTEIRKLFFEHFSKLLNASATSMQELVVHARQWEREHAERRFATEIDLRCIPCLSDIAHILRAHKVGKGLGEDCIGSEIDISSLVMLHVLYTHSFLNQLFLYLRRYNGKEDRFRRSSNIKALRPKWLLIVTWPCLTYLGKCFPVFSELFRGTS